MFFPLGTDHLNFWGGPGLFLVRPSFFFLLPENQDIFFRQVERQDIFFSDKVKADFFFDNRMNHHQSLIRTCISNFSFINLV